jgi:hypothetical protein
MAWMVKTSHAKRRKLQIALVICMSTSAKQNATAIKNMSIIQQLAEIESKALKYKQQDTMYIYTRHPHAGESVPQFEIRIDGDDQTYVRAFMDFLKVNGLCARVSSAIESHNRQNFTYLPREK